jgi:hypothetical protein
MSIPAAQTSTKGTNVLVPSALALIDAVPGAPLYFRRPVGALHGQLLSTVVGFCSERLT